jgi:protoheme IX farnesyltransferase
MNTSAQTLSRESVSEKSAASLLCELVKVRLTFLVVVTTLVGFYLGYRGPVDWVLMLSTVLGTALLACGAAALNQYQEREYDRLMRRTEDRPLPSGRMKPVTALALGAALAAIGLSLLALAVNVPASLLGAVTLITYLFAYTPLKRVTPLNTVVGAVPGALPPLIGWTAACGELTREGWALFGIQFFWQLPHFLAIAWMYREDYARAGFRMLPVVDPEGFRTGRHALSHTLGLLAVSVCPFLFKLTGPTYLVGALVLGVAFVVCALRFSQTLSTGRARQLFYASILYLPLLLILLVCDKAGGN